MKEESYLNELEKDSLIKFNQDVIMREAVKKVILKFIYGTGTLEAGKPATSEKHWVFALENSSSATQSDDAVLGKMLRTKIAASGMLEEGFRKLEEFKPESEQPKVKVNPAR